MMTSSAQLPVGKLHAFLSPSCRWYSPKLAAPKPAQIPNILLHLIHPLGCGTLRNTLPYIRSFRTFLSSRHLTNEVLQMADDVLIDMIERSGIDLIKLEPLIAQQYEDIQNLPGNYRADGLHYIDC